MAFLRRINEWLCDVFVWVGGIALIVMTSVSVLNMGLRMIGIPMAGIYDLVCYLGALVAALPLAYTQLKKGHIAVDIVALMLPAYVRKAAVAISYVLGMIFFSLASILMRSGEVSETLKMPFWPFTYAVAVSCGLMVLCLLLDLLTMFEPKTGGQK
jgi:TRAP-type C4-dicarboxylate transport system permease small subunit